jgi:hypothetical protein
MTEQTLFELLSGAKGTLGVLVVIVATGYLEVWVWGKMHRARIAELAQERDRWQQLALSTTTLARESAQIMLQQQASK